MSNKDLKLALELAAKATGREEIAELNKEVGNLGPISNAVEQETKELAARMQQLGQQRDQIDAFKKSKEALTQLELATVLSRDKLEEFRKSQKSGSGDAQDLARQEQLLAREVKQLESQLVRQAATHPKLHAGLKQSGIDTQNLAGEQNRLQRELTETATRTEKLARELIGGQTGASSMATGVAGLTTRLVAMAGAYVGIQALKDAVLSFFAAGDKAEQLSIQMNAVMGSIQGGQEATAWINDFAKKTPLQLNEVTQTFIRLKAMGLDPMDGSMQAVVDQSSKLGLGFEGVESISLALGQAWAKGKLQGEEMLQMQERGVPVLDLLGKALGKTTAELGEMSAKGLLGRDAIKALIAEMGSESAGAANAQMGTMSGLLSNLGDSWTNFKVAVANSGALEWLKQQLTDLNTTINEMAADGRLKQYAQQVSDWLVTTGQSVKQFMLDIGGSFDGMLSAVNVTVQSLRVVFNAFTAAVKGMAAGFLTNLFLITTGLEKLAGALGMKGLAAELSQATGLLKAEMDAFAKSAKEDLDDIADASVRMSGTHTKATDEVKKSQQEFAKESKTHSDEVVKHQSAIADSAVSSSSALSDALKGIGLDYERLEGNVGASFKGISSALDLLVETSGVGAETIKATLEEGFKQAKNKAELDLVTQAMEHLHEQGKLVGPAYVESMSLAGTASKRLVGETQGVIDRLKLQKAAADEAYTKGQMGAEEHAQIVGKLNAEIDKTTKASQKNADAADDMTKAYSDFGMQSAKALEDQAAKLKASFQTIQSGAQPLEQIRQAFLKYAEAELTSAKANDRHADGSLSATAATLGLSKELQALETAVNTTGKEALITAGALDTLSNSTNAASGSAEKVSHSFGRAWESLEKQSEGMKKLQEHTRQASSGQLTFADVMMKSSEVAGLSLDDINTKMAEAQEIWESSYNYLQQSNDISTEWWSPFVLKQKLAQENNLQILGQMKRVREASDALASAEQPTAKLVANAERAVKAAYKLDDQTLSSFRAAIDSAKQKMNELADSAASTVSNLRDELDQLSENYDAIERRRYDEQVESLKASLETARAAGNADAVASYKEALRLAEELHQKKMATIKAEQVAAAQETAEAKKTAASNTAAKASTAAKTANQNTSETTTLSREITINLPGSRQTIKTDAAGEAALESVLRQLESVGAITP